jgi:hypothetical protein
MEEVAVLAPALATAAGIGLIRHGWGGSRAVAIGGWALVTAATLLLAALAGAWGIAIAATAAMAAAIAVLLVEAWRTPRGRTAPARGVASITLPRPTQRAVGRRLAVFALVVPGGGAATALLAFGAQAAGRRLGWVEADTTALALLAQPIAWTLLASVQMTRVAATAMIAPALACAAAGLLLWWPL